MSALPPIADMCSALIHVRFVPIADIANSLDHGVGTLLKLQGYVEAQRFCSLEVDDQLVLGRRLQRKVSRLRALEDAVDVPGCLAEQFVAVVTIRN